MISVHERFKLPHRPTFHPDMSDLESDMELTLTTTKFPEKR